nr:Trk family potassium uptake protein [Eubacterium sp.]
MRFYWLRKISPTRLIAMSFALVILTGTFLLCLPISSRTGQWTSPLDALFTSTSATCVTGLIVADTYTNWSFFGQVVILLLIQIGGIGLMTIISMIFIVAKKKLSMQERMLLMQAAGNVQVAGMVKLIKRILSVTFVLEGIGAFILAIRFVPRLGLTQGVYYAIFHSISAFCNAGFDLMGKYKPYSSLTSYQDDWLVNLTIAFLIILGGIGFLVWDDILKKQWHFHQYSLHSKLIIIATALLLLLGTLAFYVFENEYSMKGDETSERILKSFFAATTMRTAGFNTIEYSQMSESSFLLANTLMMIGGGPGSTAGGIKNTTIAVILISMFSMARGNSDTTIFKKRLSKDLVKQAAVIVIVYLTYVVLGTMFICHIEKLDLTQVSFEVISAVCTVGVTTGITPTLTPLSHVILIILMYGGRIGGFSLMLVFGEPRKRPPLKRPKEKILIG